MACWDGLNFAAVQMLLLPARKNGEPACRVLGGDFSKMEVCTVEGLVPVFIGENVELVDGVPYAW